jgi:hypothetical protein
MTAVVFMAELVLAFALIMYLLKLSKMFNKYTSIISELNPKIKEIMELCRKISEQMLEFAPIIVNTIKNTIRDIIIGQIKNLVSALTFWVVKGNVEKHLSK